MGSADQQYAKVTPDELSDLLSRHEQWIKSGGSSWFEDPPKKGGARANLGSKDLTNIELNDKDLRGVKAGYADFSSANLTSTNLSGGYFKASNFSGAMLEGSNLLHAFLEDAKFDGAGLWKADLRASILRNADLSKAEGLEAGQIAGADLTLAKLPEEISKFYGLKVVEEASKNAQQILFAVLLACVYTWLTIASTRDPALLLNSATSKLPIIGTDVKIVGFYVIAPLVLLCTYIYLHVYLQRLWEVVASLPAIFPDGRPLDYRAYPWMAMGLVRTYFPFLRTNLLCFSQLQRVLTVLLLWGVIPITEAGLWARYLPRHEWWGTVATIGALVASLIFAMLSYLNSTAVLRGQKLGPLRFKWAVARFSNWHGATVLACIAVIVGISILALEGPQISPPGHWPYANLSGEVLSQKLDGWTQDSSTEKVLGVSMADWNLRFANMSGTFLVRADLSHADLSGARLNSADLRRADLYGATLAGASLSQTELSKARLEFANLRGIKFLLPTSEKVGMPHGRKGSGFSGGSYFGSVNITGADFTAADLSGADLEGWYTDDNEFHFLGANLYGVSNAGRLLEEAIRGGAVCMENQVDWNKVAHGIVEIPDVPGLIDVADYCHVKNPLHKAIHLPSQ